LSHATAVGYSGARTDRPTPGHQTADGTGSDAGRLLREQGRGTRGEGRGKSGRWLDVWGWRKRL